MATTSANEKRETATGSSFTLVDATPVLSKATPKRRLRKRLAAERCRKMPRTRCSLYDIWHQVQLDARAQNLVTKTSWFENGVITGFFAKLSSGGRLGKSVGMVKLFENGAVTATGECTQLVTPSTIKRVNALAA